MPISPARRVDHAWPEAGLTLVEMLVVLAIMGVVSAAAVMGLGGINRDDSVEAEARRLGARLQLAADDAMVIDRPVTLAWDDRGYAFAGVTDMDELGDRRDLPSGMTLSIPAEGTTVLITANGAGRPIEATLAKSSIRWTVRFDGIAVAVERGS